MSNKIASDSSFDKIVFDEATQYRGQQFSNVSLSDCDLNGAIFFGCTFKNCTFKNTSLRSARLFAGCTFEDCEFTKCDLSGVGIEDGKARFSGTTFKSCDMRGTDLDRARWSDCVFEKCNIKDGTFHVSHWSNCRFSGALKDINFVGERRQKLLADFGKCKLDCVTFRDCDLSACVPPAEKFHFYVVDMASKIQHAPTLLEDADEQTKKLVGRRLKALADMDQYIFNTKSLRDIEGDAVAERIMKIFSIGP